MSFLFPLCTLDGIHHGQQLTWGRSEYTVKDWKRLNTGGEWKEDSDNYQMWSPNSDDVGHDYVCAWDDDCWQKGDEWWGPSRTPGGPKQYDFDDKWQ